MQKDFWRDLFRPENKKTGNNILLVLLIGVLLVVLGKTFFPTEEKIVKASHEEQITEVHNSSEQNMERRLAEILSKIQGAGQVDVMLTFRAGTESVVAHEEKTEETRSQENGKNSENLRKESSVVMTEDGNGSTSPLVLMENFPQVEGVVIVAEGGNNAVVCQALSSAAQALLDVPAHKIAILKMK
ncbi:hypothetical protein CLNEO_15910 [Anaerotignum neopropionicum]|uniref:Stage III sporulation protein AG n=1 Tax=Anaerotignum neopropionicum TaxID=36847 RepID=A0A136WET8_9FIRM|nr:hypothetical protein [Anaerotignum neopropionicum]KXL53048.1 hypothetical protein CLNEO_15910 [Anaerotignum neopropionicum]